MTGGARTRRCGAAALVAVVLALAACTSDDPAADRVDAATDPATEEPAGPDDRTRVVFVTDYALGLVNGTFGGFAPGPAPPDDAFAVALAATAPDELDVRGLVITHGNDVMAAEVIAATQGLEEMGLDVPVVSGPAIPLPNPPIETVDGAPLTGSCIDDGVRFLADELRDGPLTVLAIGPFSALACLALEYPDEAANIDEVIALAGSKGEPLLLGTATVPDMNFTADPYALQVLLEQTEIPFTSMMFEVTSTAGVTAAQLRSLAEGPAVSGRYLGTGSVPSAEATGGTLTPFDPHTVNRLLHPDDYVCATAGFALTVGVPDFSPSPTNAFVVGEGLGGRPITACDAWSSPDRAAVYVERVLAAAEDA